MNNPLREAMEAGDTCEVGRLLMERHRELLESPPFPDVTDSREPVLPDGWTAPNQPLEF